MRIFDGLRRIRILDATTDHVRNRSLRIWGRSLPTLWAVEDRVGVPRYSANVETVMLWPIYNAGISVAIIVILQTLRDI